MEEVPPPRFGHHGSTWTVLESELSCHQIGVQMPFSVVMPAGGRAARHLGPGDHDSLPIEGFLAANPVGRIETTELLIADHVNVLHRG